MTQRFRLHPAWTWSRTADGVIELFSRVDHRRFAVCHTSQSELEALFSMLEAGVELKDVDRQLAALPASSIVRELTSRAMVVVVEGDEAPSPNSADEPAGDEYFERQRRFLELYDDTMVKASDRQERLENTRVVVVGAGGWGCWTILNLSRMGFRDVVVFDDDLVELSNLNRQILFGVDDVGKLKVDAVASRIDVDTGGRCHITAIPQRFQSEEDLEKLRTDATVLMNPFGYFGGLFQYVARVGFRTKIATLNYGSNWVGPFTTHDSRTPCLDCAMSDMKIADAMSRWDRAWGFSAQATSGIISARPAANCAFACWELFQHVTGIRVPQTTMGIAMIDSFDYNRTRFYEVARNDRCPTCGVGYEQ